MCSSSKKPVIGISVGTSLHWRRSGRYFRAYAAPVEAAGGECVPLGAYAGKDLGKVDGLLVPGGWDIHPDLYLRMAGDESLDAEQVMHKYSVNCEARRDEFELAFIREALATRKPVLGICRGFQALNIVLGDRLIPDIPSSIETPIRHRSPGFGVSLSHEISIEPGSLMERVYGGLTATVNTRHHQGLTSDMVSGRLKTTALAPDGVVEAVEMPGEHFVVGVQWHPERQKDDFIYSISGPLFEAFVAACEKAGNGRRL